MKYAGLMAQRPTQAVPAKLPSPTTEGQLGKRSNRSLEAVSGFSLVEARRSNSQSRAMHLKGRQSLDGKLHTYWH